MKPITSEELIVWFKNYTCTITGLRLFCYVTNQPATFKDGFSHVTILKALYFKTLA